MHINLHMPRINRLSLLLTIETIKKAIRVSLNDMLMLGKRLTIAYSCWVACSFDTNMITFFLPPTFSIIFKIVAITHLTVCTLVLLPLCFISSFRQIIFSVKLKHRQRL